MSMAPYLDPRIVDRFQQYDPLLRFKWNGEMNLWELWRGHESILRVSEDNNAYRAPDERLYAYLHTIDSWTKRRGALDIAHEMDARNEARTEASRRRSRLA